MARKLKILTPREALRTGSMIDGVAVLEQSFLGDSLGAEPIFGVHVRPIGQDVGVEVIEIDKYSHTGTYPIQSIDDYTLDQEKGTLTFTSRGRDYVVRAFQDSDKKWFLDGSNKKTASAEQMEKMFMKSIENRYI